MTGNGLFIHIWRHYWSHLRAAIVCPNFTEHAHTVGIIRARRQIVHTQCHMRLRVNRSIALRSHARTHHHQCIHSKRCSNNTVNVYVCEHLLGVCNIKGNTRRMWIMEWVTLMLTQRAPRSMPGSIKHIYRSEKQNNKTIPHALLHPESHPEYPDITARTECVYTKLLPGKMPSRRMH